MTDLLTASKKAFRTLRHHQADISYVLPLRIIAQLKEAIDEEKQRRAGINSLEDEITTILFDANRINSLNEAGEIAGEIMALIASYLAYDEEAKESQGVEKS